MWPIGIYVLALITISIAHWIYKWRNPKCNGSLPPGSLGLPVVGETIQFFIPNKSLDIAPFVKDRIKKYGPLFKTSLAGRPVVVSSDAAFNHFILQQEGKLVEVWYMDSFAELLGLNGSLKNALAGQVHKHLKKSISEHIGLESLKGKLLPELEEMVNHTFSCWTKQEVLEVKHACSEMLLKFGSKLLFGYDPEKSGENLTETFGGFIKGLMSFPLNIPGTAFHKCLQKQKKILKLVQEMIDERRASPEIRGGDFLERLVDDMKTDNLLTDKVITYVIFVLLFATSETITATLSVAIKLLAEHPLVMQELVKENEEIISRREDKQSGITWKEYKSMTFTMNVINEALRISGGVGILRRAIQDIYRDGYIIPKGWAVFLFNSAVYLNPDTYEDPLAFNPWRWKDSAANLSAKNFIPFGGGMRSCSGAEFSKVLMAAFLHVLVTKYRWTEVKGGQFVRAPMLVFEDGYYIKVSEKAETNVIN